MTPLAHMIVADATLPAKERRFTQAMQALRLLDGVHFFEVSAVRELAFDLAAKLNPATVRGAERLAFLPAPRTWLEWSYPGEKVRYALLLEQDGDGCLLSMVTTDEERRVVATPGGHFKPVARIALSGAPDFGRYEVLAGAQGLTDAARSSDYLVKVALGLLAMINTPKVMARRVHEPHAGLQRKLAQARGMTGKFPLRAWTEIVLEVRPPDALPGEIEGNGFSGRKALHFVRAHLRIQNGSLVLVSAHWRGDAALGICRSRYRLELPDAA